MTSDAQIAALLRERAGYVMRKLPRRVSDVDQQLAGLGHQVPAEQTMQPPVEQATRDPNRPTCDECGRSFKNEHGLSIHQSRTHEG